MTLAGDVVYDGAVIYSAEEGHSVSVQRRLTWLEIISERIWFVDTSTPLMAAFDAAVEREAEAFMVDSANLVEFAPWRLISRCKVEGITLWLILHERKDGGYRGKADMGHSTDIVAIVESYNGSVFEGHVEKSRFGSTGAFKIES
jgi:hypothetical protein